MEFIKPAKAGFINLIWNDHLCKILYVSNAENMTWSDSANTAMSYLAKIP